MTLEQVVLAIENGNVNRKHINILFEHIDMQDKENKRITDHKYLLIETLKQVRSNDNKQIIDETLDEVRK